MRSTSTFERVLSRHLVSLALLSSVGAFPAVAAAAGGDATPSGTNFKGKIIERLDAPPYSYLKIADGNGEIWAAVPKTDLKEGDEASVVVATAMKGFESRTLSRKFDVIYFGTLESTAKAATPSHSEREQATQPKAAQNAVPKSGNPSKGWMCKRAVARRAFWNGNRYLDGFGSRKIPAEDQPWVFLATPPDCPSIPGANWTSGDLPYWMYIVDQLPNHFLEKQQWSTVRATGKVMRTSFPRGDGLCGVYYIEWVEVEFVPPPPVAQPNAEARPAASTGGSTPTLCKNGEVSLEVCTLKGTNRQFAFCGSPDLSRSAGTLVFRYGRLGSVEVEYPSTKLHPSKAFRAERSYSRRGSDLTVKIEQKGSTYTVLWDDSNNSPEGVGLSLAIKTTRGKELVLDCSSKALAGDLFIPET